MGAVQVRNRGYVLDGFPKTLLEARTLFTDARTWTAEELEAQAAAEANIKAAAAQAEAKAKESKGKGKAEDKSKGAKGAPVASKIEDVPDPRALRHDLLPQVLVLYSSLPAFPLKTVH